MTEKILYETFNPVTQRSTEIVTDSETGLPVIITSQNTRPIVESAKQLASNFDKHRPNPDGITHVARIPMVIWQQLQKLGITKDQKALNAWLDNRDQRVFRVDDGRKL
jgi:hypothetical protein